MDALLLHGDAHDTFDDAANIVRCMKCEVKCSWRAHLTHVFTTPQVFPLARTTGECSSAKRSRTAAEKWYKQTHRDVDIQKLSDF